MNIKLASPIRKNKTDAYDIQAFISWKNFLKKTLNPRKQKSFDESKVLLFWDSCHHAFAAKSAPKKMRKLLMNMNITLINSSRTLSIKFHKSLITYLIWSQILQQKSIQKTRTNQSWLLTKSLYPGIFSLLGQNTRKSKNQIETELHLPMRTNSFDFLENIQKVSNHFDSSNIYRDVSN